MPHLILEISDNLVQEINHNSLFSELHQLLSQRLPTDIKSCKSRLITHENYYLGDGNEPQGFMHLTLKVMPGRHEKKLAEICQEILVNLNKYTKITWPKLQIATSIELLELAPLYFK